MKNPNLKICLVFKFNKIRERDWSGVPASLSSALGKYTELSENHLFLNKREKMSIWLRKLKDRILFHSRSFSIPEILAYSKKVEKDSNGDVLLAFSEIVTAKAARTYIYQDLSVDYVARLYEDKDPLLQYTPLDPMTNRKIVVERRNIQNEFYKKCAGVFTMSKWMANDLTEHTKIAKSKVHVVGGHKY